MALNFNFGSSTPVTTFSTFSPVPGLPRRREDDGSRPGFGLFVNDGASFSSGIGPRVPLQFRGGRGNGGGMMFGIQLSQTASYVNGTGQVQVNGSIRVMEEVIEPRGLVSEATQTVGTPTIEAGERPQTPRKRMASGGSESGYSQEDDDVVDAGKENINTTGGAVARSSTGSGWVEIEVEELEDDGRPGSGVEGPEEDEISVLGYYVNRESRATVMQTMPAIEEVDDEPLDRRYSRRRDAGRRRYR